jgi:hypothetical protein
MDANLPGHVKQFINKNLSGDAASNSDALTFIWMKLMNALISPSLAVVVF